MSELGNLVFEPFRHEQDFHLLQDVYDPEFFGNGIVDFIYRDLFVRITRDRGQIFGSIGLNVDGTVYMEDIAKHVRSPQEGAGDNFPVFPDDSGPYAMGEFILRNYAAILGFLQSRGQSG